MDVKQVELQIIDPPDNNKYVFAWIELPLAKPGKLLVDKKQNKYYRVIKVFKTIVDSEKINTDWNNNI